MKVSEITPQKVANQLRLDDDDWEENELESLIEIAKSYIKSYTGLTLERIDEIPEFVHAAFVLCQDMYDNRAMYVDKINVNKVVETILGMHSINLLPSGG